MRGRHVRLSRFRLPAALAVGAIALALAAGGLPVASQAAPAAGTPARVSDSARGSATPGERPGGRGETPAGASARPTLPYSDVEGPVAEALAVLKDRGVLAAFPGDRFRPDRPITLGEFARAAAAAFGLTAPRDLDPQHGAVVALQERRALAPGGEPEVDLPVSRAALLTAVVELTGSGDVARQLSRTFASARPAELEAGALRFAPLADVAPDDPVFGVALLSYAAGLLPADYVPRLQPRLPATRGEAAIVLVRALGLGVAAGELDAAASGRLDLLAGQPLHGGQPVPAAGSSEGVPGGGSRSVARIRFDAGPQTVILRNGRPVSASDLRRGDRATVVADTSGRARLVVASGPLATAEWVAQGRQLLRSLARELTPDQWQAILRGDWSGLAASLTPQLYDHLMALGVAPWEADALLQQDWAAVLDLAKDRLAREGASRLQVSPEVLRAVLDEDWQSARQLAQQELLQRLLDELLAPEGPGAA